jgi:hypothetical protein
MIYPACLRLSDVIDHLLAAPAAKPSEITHTCSLSHLPVFSREILGIFRIWHAALSS